MVLERTGRCLRKDQSPLNEKDTFALFDEPRCRGVDLKLRPDAVALLTLGQHMSKDKFMQAAGRMRQLHNGQSIVIVGEKKIFKDMRRRQNRKQVDTTSVLDWIMQNTVESIVKGLSAWSDQGMFFETEEEPHHSLLEDKHDLQAFYMKSTHEIPLPKLAKLSQIFHSNRTGNQSDHHTSRMKTIVTRCEDLGSGYSVHRSSMDEECERELEREVEQEEEEEIEFAKMSPEAEVDWDFASIFRSKSCEEIDAPVTPLSTVICKFMSNQNVSRIGWSDTIFCTNNFIRTVISQEKDGTLDNFLRMPDCLVHFHCGDVLLLSDREGAQILPLFLDKKENESSPGEPYFGHYAFETTTDSFLRCDPRPQGHPIRNLDGNSSCSLKLFNGDTMYPGDQYQILKQMLFHCSNANSTSGVSDKSMTIASGEPEVLVVARGKLSDYDMSDLERISKEISCEKGHHVEDLSRLIQPLNHTTQPIESGPFLECI